MMTYRKSRFSYIVWFLYAAVCVMLSAIGAGMWAKLMGVVSDMLPVAAGVAAILLSYLTYRLMEKIAAWVMRSYTWNKKAAIAVECIAVLCIVAAAVLIRAAVWQDAVAQLADGTAQADIFAAGGQAYYERAAVTRGGGAGVWTDYGIGDLYVALLSFTLSFLGNKAMSAVFLQAVLQVIAVVLAYVATRKLAGRLAACAASAYLAGSFACLRMLFIPGPEWLFFILYLIGLLAAGSFVKGYCANRFPRPAALAVSAVIGAVTGALAYLDVTAASLLVIMLAAAVGKKNKQAEMQKRSSAGMSAAVILTAVLVFAGVYCGALQACAHAGGADFAGCLAGRLQACYDNSYILSLQQPYAADLYLMGGLVFFALFLVYAFIRNGKTQNYMPWLLLSLAAAPAPLAVYGEHGFGVLSLYVWAVLAGLGLHNCIFGSRPKVMKTMIEQINTAAGTDSAPEVVQEAAAAAPVESREAETVYIENPLPLPKKHVRRDMDYQYEVPEQDMKYDIDIAPDDDFDIQ